MPALKKYQKVEKSSVSKNIEWRVVKHDGSGNGWAHLLFEKKSNQLIGSHSVGGSVYLAEEFNSEYGDEFKENYGNFKTLPFDEILVEMANVIVKYSNEVNDKKLEVDQTPNVETCFHLGAKVMNSLQAYCPKCQEKVSSKLVMGNLLEQLSTNNELFWTEEVEKKEAEKAKALEKQAE